MLLYLALGNSVPEPGWIFLAGLLPPRAGDAYTQPLNWWGTLLTWALLPVLMSEGGQHP